MDIFEKCYAPSLATDLQEKGVYPYFRALQSRQDVEVMMEGKRRPAGKGHECQACR